MTFDMNMVTKDGKKMMYLIAIDVKEDCEYYDEIWTELRRRMNAVSIPIVRVDWPLYDDVGQSFDFSKCLFYAQTFEIAMGFILSILDDHTIRSNLKSCNFFYGDAYRNNTKKYDAEDSLEVTKKYLEKYHPGEVW